MTTNPYQSPQSHLSLDKDAYPKAKIVLLFTLFGSILGGVLFTLIGIAWTFIQSMRRFSLPSSSDISVNLIIPVMLIVTIMAIFPAFIVGLLTALMQLRIKSYGDYFKLFLIGLIITAILVYVLAWLVALFIPPIVNLALGNIQILALSGGLSCVIVGKFVLPKAKL